MLFNLLKTLILFKQRIVFHFPAVFAFSKMNVFSSLLNIVLSVVGEAVGRWSVDLINLG